MTFGIVSLILIILVGYIVVTFFMYFYQEKFIFFPTRVPLDFVYDFYPNATELFFDTDDGETLHSLYFKSQNTKGVVLYFHGNSEGIDSWGIYAEDFTKHDYDVLMPDYRSYGKSSGTLSAPSFRSDALLFYNYLSEKFPPEQIIILGRSLGSGIASDLATKVKAKLLILETPYLSIAAMAKLRMRFLPINYLLKYNFDNYKNLQLVNFPIHIFHGTHDELIPYQQAVALAQLFPNQDILTTIENGGHNNLGEFPSYQSKLEELLQ